MIKHQRAHYLPGGVPIREASASERKFFRARRDVSGLAADDGSVVLNPYVSLSKSQVSAVALNEAARIVMRRLRMQPIFEITDEQRRAFAEYGSLEDIRATIAARILSEDPSALTPTSEQLEFVSRLAEQMALAPHAKRGPKV